MSTVVTPVHRDKRPANLPAEVDAQEPKFSEICDRDRLLQALASHPFLAKEIGEQLIRDVQEAREESIARESA